MSLPNRGWRLARERGQHNHTAKAALESEFGRLLQWVFYGAGDAHGADVAVNNRYFVQAIALREPDETPAVLDGLR